MSPVAFRFAAAAAVALAGLSVAPAAHAQQTTPPKKPAVIAARTVYDHPLLQKTVSLSLKDATVNKAVEELAKVSGLNLVIERPATLTAKPLSLELKEAKLGDVLDALGRLYGYRWQRVGEVFMLTLLPPETTVNSTEDLIAAAKGAAKNVWDNVLTADQKEKMGRDGFISGKELTPGQQGVIWGHVMDILGGMQSGLLSNGRFIANPETGSFAIAPAAPPAAPAAP